MEGVDEPQCQCPACWCRMCGADLARFPEAPGVEHVCPPSPVEVKGIGDGGHSWDDIARMVGYQD